MITIRRHLSPVLALASIALSLTACEPRMESRGFVRDAEIEGEVKIGETTKGDVLNRLGSPSSRSSFGPEAWYYVTTQKQSTAFLKPELTDQSVLRIEFDSSDVVSKVERFGKDNTKMVEMVERTTPTEGHSLGVLEQLLGNLGRFNKPRSKTPAGGKNPIPGR